MPGLATFGYKKGALLFMTDRRWDTLIFMSQKASGPLV